MKLRECPFCGKTKSSNIFDSNEIDYLSPSDSDFDDNPTFAVVCNIQEDGCGASSGYYDTKEFAVTAWNTRHDNCQNCTEAKSEHEMYIRACEQISAQKRLIDKLKKRKESKVNE